MPTSTLLYMCWSPSGGLSPDNSVTSHDSPSFNTLGAKFQPKNFRECTFKPHLPRICKLQKLHSITQHCRARLFRSASHMLCNCSLSIGPSVCAFPFAWNFPSSRALRPNDASLLLEVLPGSPFSAPCDVPSLHSTAQTSNTENMRRAVAVFIVLQLHVRLHTQ